jgi:hypothetical protein
VLRQKELGMARNAFHRRGRFTVAALAVSTALGVAAAPSASAATTVTTVLSGLNNPRGVAFDSTGHLYVSESGIYSNSAPVITRTGRVTKYGADGGTWRKAWTTGGFESLSDAENGPEVLGPEGISAGGGNVAMIMSESIDGVRAGSGLAAHQLGVLFGLDPVTGRPSRLSNVGNQEYDWTGDHQGLASHDFPDSNPYAVLLTGSGSHQRTFVADAGANTVNEVRSNGTVRVLSYIPNDNNPDGSYFDSTPTCIAKGRDGMLYVATLDLLPNSVLSPTGPPNIGGNPGHSNVWRVNPNASYPTPPELWATGLTTVSACTFDRAGNFWATELFRQNPQGPPGDLVKIVASEVSRRTTDDLIHIGGGSLPLPGGIAQGPGGAMFVSLTADSPTPGTGSVAKVSP